MLYPIIQKLYFVHFWRCSTLGKFKKIQTRHFHLLNEHLLHSVYSEKLCRGNDIPYYTGVQSKRRFYPNLWAHDILSCNLTASEWKLTEALLSLTHKEGICTYLCYLVHSVTSSLYQIKSQIPHVSNCLDL